MDTAVIHESVFHYTPWRRLGKRKYNSYTILTSALDGGEWSASRPGHALAPRKGPPVPIGQEGQDTEARGIILRLCQGLNPDRPVLQSVNRQYYRYNHVSQLLLFI
jgi:hypothetical protein